MMDAVATEPADPADLAPAVMMPARSAGPGALRGEVALTLNTLHALNLFTGRTRTGDDGTRIVPGVYRFANYLEQVGVGVSADDPYADWTMIRVERLMAGACSFYGESYATADNSEFFGSLVAMPGNQLLNMAWSDPSSVLARICNM